MANAGTQFLKSNIGLIGAGVGGAALGAGVVGAAVAVRRKKRRKSVKATHRRKKSRSHRRARVKHTKRTSHKRIHYTKTGQPYIILRSGKARFIKRKSARTSRKRRGGRY